MELVSIIVLNWNGKHLLADCLESIQKQSYSQIETIVVDNGSTDDSLDFMRKNYPDVKIIVNDKNEGFCKAMNQGMKATTGTYKLPLNNDVTLSPDFVKDMVKAAEPAEVGLVTGKLIRVSKTKEEVIDSAGHVMFKNRMPRNRGDGLDVAGFDKPEFVFGACGAAPLYKQEMLDDIAINGEYYDEDFFSFLEDVDLDWRAQLRGWKCKYTPDAIAYHWRGGTAVRRSTIVEKHNYKNRYLMLLKNDSLGFFLLNLPQILFTDIVKSSALLFRAPTALTGWFSLIRLFPKTLRKRRYIQKNRKVKPSQIEKMFVRFDYSGWIKKHMTEDVHSIKNQ
ncbi:hypothetical protein LCGC14_0799840 [marine sediment metagenome]|uniref:Glycosyltransferase 2-like domain-containing protein n=1 Tax=marine sediment metagenome TaxID=412755 RepID=A0A0F9PUH6_9ZZZZ